MATFLQVSARGSYTSGAWSGEIAQCAWTLQAANDDPTTTPVTNVTVPEWSFDDTAGSGNWANGNYVQGFGGDVIGQAEQDAIAVCVKAWIEAVDAYQSSAFRWSTIVMSLIQWDSVPPTGWGQVMQPSTYNIIPTVQGDLVSSALPPQCAVCVSHYTNGSGSRNRGRVFVPFHKPLSSASQLVETTDNAALANAQIALFDALAAVTLGEEGMYLTPSVTSRVHQTYSTIADVRVGDEVDTQRRRRNARSETYTAYPWPAA